MSNLMKRSLIALACTGLTASVLIAQSGTPSTPPVPSKESINQHSKDAVDKAKKHADDAMKNAQKDANKQIEDAKKAVTGADHATPDEAMMAEMMKSMQPGPMHAWLKKWEGNWDLTVKSYHSPGGEPEVMKMTSVSALSMGGRYIVEKVSGDLDIPGMGKMPFEGESVMGYDNAQKRFFSTWRDNMSTGMMFETGTVDAGGKVLTSEGENWNMNINAMGKSKSVATIVDDNHRTLEMWAAGPDGQMAKQMEIHYTRR